MTDIIKISNDIDAVGVSSSHSCPPENCHKYINKNKKAIKILQYNIRSINCNFNAFLPLLTIMKIECDLIVLTECWLSKVVNLPIIPGFVSYNTNNNSNQNDGLVIYIRDDIICNVTEPEFQDGTCLVSRIGRFTAVVTIYRSPSYKNIDRFINSLNNVLQSLSSFRDIVITGDLNIDIKTDTKETGNRDELLNLTAFHGLLPTHLLPTRMDSLKCLDHVLLKSNRDSVTLILQFHLTDHCPILLCLYKALEKDLTIQTFNRVNYDAIVNEIYITDFSHILSLTNANEAASEFVSQIRSIIGKHSKKLSVTRQKKVLKPWITTGLLRCIRHRDKLHKKLRKSPDNPTIKTSYNRYRNFLNNLLKKLKREHEQYEFLNAKKNPKKTWNIIKNILHVQKASLSPRDLLKLDPDPELSANIVNDFFSNIGSTLASKINKPISLTVPISQNVTLNSLALYPTDESEVENIILNLHNDCAVGWDGISTKILKLSINPLVPIITHISNTALSNGGFPDPYKKALVHPIFKSGDRDNVNNYRPISILPSLSKIMEKLLNKRLTNYLEQNKVISNKQFGFRRGKSTEDAVGGLVNEIARNLDNKRKCLAIFLDLSKAFDTVSIPLLLDKMSRMGIRGLALEIFHSYLTNRKQFVKLGEYTSEEASPKYGVPQGSVLGPTLFQIYVNELCDLSLPNSQIFCYADDTVLLVDGNSWEETKRLAENAITEIMAWLNNNLLTLNVDKTKYITFSLTLASQPSKNNFNIKGHICHNPTNNCTCPFLTRTDNIKYLGVYIDQLLNWNTHIDSLTSRTRKLIYIFKNLRSSANIKTLKLVYSSLSESVLRYCISVWGGSAKTKMLQLERAQRAVLKVILKKPIRYPTTNIYNDSKVLTVRQLFVLQTILRIHPTLPYDPELKEKKRRSDRVCVVEGCRTTTYSRFFPIIAPQLYNRINKTLNIYNLNTRKLKTTVIIWLLQLSYKSTEELLNFDMSK